LKNKSIIYGIRVVIEAIESGKELEKVMLNKSRMSPLKAELIELMKQRGIVSQNVPDQKLNRITSKNHQGVIAFLSPIVYADLENVVMDVFEKGDDPFFLVLDGVTDIRNLGAIARTAECAGVHGIIIPQKGMAAINEDAVKSSAGALLKLPVCRVKYLEDAISYLKDSGMKVIAATEKSEMDIHESNEECGPCVLVMGSEESGVSERILKLTDEKLKIPMTGSIASLNVSVAAGIMMYEIIRRKGIAN
jgi:23S rRNA (guanosine2251-2'-O)-methyltransferase